MIVVNGAAITGPHAGYAMRPLETAAHGKPSDVRQVSGDDGFKPLGADMAEDVLLCPTLSTSGGTSDGRFLVTLGSQVVELGPCNGTIHQRNECIASTDPARLSAIYQRLLLNLLTP